MLFGVAIFYARPAYRGTTKVTQPDGSSVTIRLVGDEYLHYNTTDDGYLLVRRDDGAYVYAQLDAEGQPSPTALLAHDVSERTAEEHNYVESVGRLKPQMTAQNREMRRQNQRQRTRALSQSRANQYDYSKFRGLVILVEYNDCSFRYNDYADIMEEMINADDYTGDSRTNINEAGISCTGSIRDYYRDNSSGLFVPTFDVVGPVKINRSQYYANGNQNGPQLIIDACTAADSQVNFKDYDVNNDGTVDEADDINKDGDINDIDRELFARLEYLNIETIGDLNSDGVVDILDGVEYIRIQDELEAAEKEAMKQQ